MTYYEKNKEKVLAKQKEYYKNNPDKVIAKNKKRSERNKKNIEAYKKKRKLEYERNKEKKLAAVRKYKLANKEKIKKQNSLYRQFKKKNDSLYNFKNSIRNLIRNAFKRKRHLKTSKTTDILGCTINFFKEYIEKQFEPWMNWDNRGIEQKNKRTWQIDHIIPLDSAKTEEEVIKLNHHTNLRPLCSKKNRLKSNKIMVE